MSHLINVVLLVLVISYGEGAKILGIFHSPGPSQYLAGKTMMKTLARKGHDVTIMAPFEDKNPPKNFKQVVLSGASRYDEMVTNFFEESWISLTGLLGPIMLSSMLTSLAENTFNHKEFQKFMSSGKKFDVVILEAIDSEALRYVAKHFNASLIMYSSLEANHFVNPYQGNPEHPAYMPSLYLTDSTCHMTFFERVQNTLFYVYTHLWRSLVVLPTQNKMLHKYYPDAPDLNDIIYGADLVFLNINSAIQEPLPKVPSVIDIGGFHIEEPKKLPEDLQKILENSKNGVVYFSLGTNLLIQQMPKEKLKIILSAFSGINETVLMKSDLKELPGKPDNVVLREWLPQNDILAHKNVKLFVSHGGLFSTMEAVYHGVPILAIPVFVDQNSNAKRAEISGYARSIPFKEVKTEIFNEYLHELLENPKYKENVMRRSILMKDKPLAPSETLNYWVEYVVRHKGAPHFRVAALDLNWYEYLLLDVIFFISISSITVIYILKLLVRNIFTTKPKNKIKNN